MFLYKNKNNAMCTPTVTLEISSSVISVHFYNVYDVHNIDQYFVQEIMPHTSHIISISLETGIFKSLQTNL